MTTCNDCLKANVNALNTPQNETCSATVHENVCVQGTVTITPSLVSGTSRSFCLGDPVIGSCDGTLARFCTFTVSQNICVQIPLTFSATAAATANGIVCGTPEATPCPGVTVGCTHTLGFYRNHPEVTNALITAAGGSITLGNGMGLSFVVTTANANDVLDFNTPVPPAPEDPPFSNQYQVLYAQLLTAKLNVLALTALGEPICAFATAAIAAADTFLGASPAGGMAGAPDVQEPLALFNEGNAPGCPEHCEDENNGSV